MTRHIVPNARGRSMLHALSALGLVRVIGEQADPAMRSWSDGFDLHVDTTVPDLVTWLINDYVPTPVLSPWNEGSGYGVKDKQPRRSLLDLLQNDDPRYDDFRAAHVAAEPLANRFRAENWAKGRLVGELRSVCPDAMLPWLDAAVVLLQGDQLAFPPLLGTGGNDGRLDFSTNFHQQLLMLVGVEGRAVERAGAWARSWLRGSSDVPLVHSAVGQFDPGASGTPNSSPWGAAESVVNPWQFVMMIEGAMLFASAPARRLSAQAERSSRVAMTFSTFGSDAGSNTGTPVEQSRGEVWIPWWQRPLSYAAMRRLFGEGRAVWRGNTATTSSQMYLATAARGVTPGVDGFDRYTIVRRNGLSFSAVLADSPLVTANAMVGLVEQTEDWCNQFATYGDRAQAIQLAWRRFDAARVALVRDDVQRPDLLLCAYLASITRLELAVAHSTTTRSGGFRPRTPRRAGAQELLRLATTPEFAALLTDPAFRVAAAFASVRTAATNEDPAGRSMRQILLPVDPPRPGQRLEEWRADPLVDGLGTLDVIELLASVAARIAVTHHAELPGTRSRGGSGEGARSQLYGVTGPAHGVGIWADDLHWLVDQRPGKRIDSAHEWFLALLALDWTWTRGEIVWTAPRPDPVVPDPLLTALLGLRHGLGAEPPHRRAGTDSDPSHDTDTDVARYGLRPEWFGQLRAGHLDRVHHSVASRLRQVGRSMVEPIAVSRDRTRGTAMAAALLPRCRDWQRGLDRVSRDLRSLLDDDPPSDDRLPSTTDSVEETA